MSAAKRRQAEPKWEWSEFELKDILKEDELKLLVELRENGAGVTHETAMTLLHTIAGLRKEVDDFTQWNIERGEGES